MIKKIFKARRQMWLTVAFCLLWAAFPLAYLGGTGGNVAMVAAAFGLIGGGCLLCILAGK